MKNVLYIGNNLNNNRSNVSAIGVFGPLLASEGYTLYYASSKSNKLWRLLDMLFSVCRHARYVDVVLIDTYSTINFYYAILVSQLCRLLGLPYISILHGGNLLSRLVNSPKLSHLIFDHAKILVAPSTFLKQTFQDYGYQNITYIPNSISINQYPFNTRSFDRINLLWVRSFAKIYNPVLAINILKSLRDEGIDATLCMVGPDSDGSLKEVKNLAKKLDLSVKFTGKLTKMEWTNISQDYNIFINTTNFDNMPVSVIEAMALGLVVVSTNVGGMPYLIKNGDNGILVEPNKSQLFVNAIKDIKGNPIATEKLIKNARHHVEQFDWNVVKQLWFNILP